ncbi:serine/threonine-protein kinase [Nonomuraea soli]|uniref:non-specific serine/threonine protein kinase n=1 Tax=Nonomuraea soli TaxID=1032476 RepID=A0A7W0HMG1_9ACTN|nr:serine/threonine-protein kinase [Nonomuraea soli]MBA2888715.1 putative Ser/Thr protein kinase [Nonomuraea soli]
MSKLAPLRAEDPRRLGAYDLVGRLGQGGQGVVYLGEPAAAVKLLHASVDERRMRGEIEALRRVAPFCTAPLLDAGIADGRPYLVSEYVDGVSLREHVIASGPRTGGSLHRLAIGMATALAAIHRAGVVHRDFKPGNVLLGLDGVRVIDFGVARLVGTDVTTGLAVGSPAYMAPEQVKGEVAGPAADLYAFGLTVAFTANGRHAYGGATYQEVLAKIVYGRADLGELSGSLREIVEGCLAPDPEERPSAEEVLRLLRHHDAPATARSEVSAARPVLVRTLPGGEAAAPRRRRPAWWQVLVLAAGLAAAVAGFVLWLDSPKMPTLTGHWTGTAVHPAAGRVFPVELDLAGEGDSRMRWGADLHCEGMLSPGGKPLTFSLDRVEGKECYPGTVVLGPTRDSNQLDIKVSRSGDNTVTYSGTVARPS